MSASKIRLGVNIDHVATLRQARGTPYPDLVAAADACARAGAEGITIHLREDRRHIQDADVHALRERSRLPINLEMANAPAIVAIALEVEPDEVCLVPEKRRELTTEGGLDVAREREALRPTVEKLREAGVIVSLFVDPRPEQLDAAAALKVPFVEIHTGRYADAPPESRGRELDTLVGAARHAHDIGLSVNAGHGINLENVAGILEMPHLHTLNIGHSIVARAVFVGMEEAVREMIRAMAAYAGGRP